MLVQPVNFAQQTFNAVSVGGFFESFFANAEHNLNGWRFSSFRMKQVIYA